ncbi:sigma-54 dependent transcriptional regulator [Pirellulales bacterium]|nr:sigma-54 dependent transcriptional regulator [Pirellulales bacterium]
MHILHYNDEEIQLHDFLGQRGHTNAIVAATADPFEVVARERFDAAFVGLHPHGLRLIQALREFNPHSLVTIITSDQDTRMAVEAMKRGAFDYLLSPLDFSEVERTLIMMLREHEMLQEQRRLETELAAAVGGGQLLGSSEPMRKLRRVIGKGAASTAPVMITGETGTGKELVARLLHEQGARRHHPLVSINCNAIPNTLLESELFGYRKGSFTGADADRQGLLTSANGGTFLFDEISDLDLSLQGKLLRVLQQGEVLPLGDTTPRPLDVRFVAATNQDLKSLVQQGRFREDLFYRLNVVPIYVPPLRERPEDITLLTLHFLKTYAKREAKAPLRVAPAVWQWLGSHHWPGNIRELENLCQRAVAMADGDTFDTDVLLLSDSFTDFPGDGGIEGAPRLAVQRDRAERQMIEQALASHRGVVARAARSLGISRTTLYGKAKKMGIRLRP